jgi:hypothetical protein
MTFQTALAVDEDASFAMVSAEGVVNERAFGRYLRASVTVTRANGTDESFTFSLTGYIGFPPEEED